MNTSKSGVCMKCKVAGILNSAFPFSSTQLFDNQKQNDSTNKIDCKAIADDEHFYRLHIRDNVFIFTEIHVNDLPSSCECEWRT